MYIMWKKIKFNNRLDFTVEYFIILNDHYFCCTFYVIISQVKSQIGGKILPVSTVSLCGFGTVHVKTCKHVGISSQIRDLFLLNFSCLFDPPDTLSYWPTEQGNNPNMVNGNLGIILHAARRREEQDLETDLAITEKYETREEIFVY